MVTMDVTLFSVFDLERLISDLDNTLRILQESIAPLAGHDVPAPRLIHIAELEARRARYQARLIELRGPALAPRKRQAILFVAANPVGTPPLKLAEECQRIQRELRLAPHRDDFRFESRWAMTIDDLMRSLMEIEPTVLHFSGHGDASAGVMLQDDQGQSRPVSGRALAMMIAAAARGLRVVVLNACYSAAQADLLRTKVDCVIGMSSAVDDDAARTFAARFYGALGNRRSIGNAVAQGIAALAANDLPDEAVPRCLTRDGVDEHQIVLAPS